MLINSPWGTVGNGLVIHRQGAGAARFVWAQVGPDFRPLKLTKNHPKAIDKLVLFQPILIISSIELSSLGSVLEYVEPMYWARARLCTIGSGFHVPLWLHTQSATHYPGRCDDAQPLLSWWLSDFLNPYWGFWSPILFSLSISIPNIRIMDSLDWFMRQTWPESLILFILYFMVPNHLGNHGFHWFPVDFPSKTTPRGRKGLSSDCKTASCASRCGNSSRRWDRNEPRYTKPPHWKSMRET